MISEVLSKFDAVRRIRRVDPKASLEAAGEVVDACLGELEAGAERHEIPWKGAGNKTYDVYSIPGSDSDFSRGVNRSLFLDDRARFSRSWTRFVRALEKSKGSNLLSGMTGTVLQIGVRAAEAFR